MSTVLIKKNQGLQNPLIPIQHNTHQKMRFSHSKIKTGKITAFSGMMINKGDEI